MFEKIAAVPESYSFWLCEYKYNDELTGAAWMQANLIEGFFRNVEDLKKNCFSSALVLKNAEGKQKITMIWLVPTQTVPAVFNSPEIAGAKIGESFDLIQLKPLESAEDKELIVKYWLWSEEPETFSGYSYASGKIFK